MSPADLAPLGARLRAEAWASGERRAVVLAGAAPWCRAGATTLLAGAGLADPLWVGDEAPLGTRLPANRAASQLGRECEALVFDARAGFDPDAFGALAGTVAGGGLLLLLTPPLADWPAWPDPDKGRIAVHPVEPAAVPGRFLARLAAVIQASDEALLLAEDCPLPTLAAAPSPASDPTPAPTPSSGPEAYPFVLSAAQRSRRANGYASGPIQSAPLPHNCRTADQLAAVEAILHTAAGHRRRPLVLTSDRGRGKSAALGIAAAALLRQGARCIRVTAPRPAAVAALFDHAARALPEARQREGALELGDRRIEFVAPDRLATEEDGGDLVLVDEAAALPLALLERLLARHPRIVFATTVHGYEGSGRGFLLRFTRLLTARCPGWQALTLEQPVRWAAGDPVEGWVSRLLLLDAEALAATPVAGEPLRFEPVAQAALAADEPLLRELFGLLVLAHYRTRPFDLRHLLDGPNVTIQVARLGARIAAVALVAAEGGFDAPLAAEVAAGRRRPRGHLLPQSLATHAGLVEAPLLRCARVVRIAVHPAVQGRGIGSALLAQIGLWAAEAGFDTLGSSFGASPELIRFWRRAGAATVRVGLSREASSGAPSVMVLRGLTAAGERLCAQARRGLARQLPELLAEPLADLDPAIAAALLAGLPLPSPAADDLAEATAFIAGTRGYEMSLPGLRQVVLAILAQESAAAEAEPGRQAVIARVIQRRPWAEVARRCRLAGRAGVEEAIRAFLASHGGNAFGG